MTKLSIVSTSQGNRIRELEALLNSVSKINNQDDIIFIFYDQCPEKCAVLFEKYNIKNLVYISGKLSSLSSARNECLNYVSGGYVCFADDDAIYPPDCYESFTNTIKLSFGSVFIGKVINEETGEGYGGRVYPDSELCELSFDDMIYLGMSLSLYLPYISDMKFDNNLGAGAKYGGSEETDLLLKYKKIKKVFYSKNLTVQHPNEDPGKVSFKKYYNYSIGYSLVLLRSIGNNKIGVIKTLFRVFIRTLGGVVFSRNRKLYLSRLLGLVVGGGIYVKEKFNSWLDF